MFINTISESKYQTFKQCQLKYRYRYVERLPEPEEANTEALQFGSYIHKVLEDGVDAKSCEDLVKIAEQVRPSYKVSEKYEGKDLTCFQNFFEFNAKLGESLATELVFEVPLKGDITLNGIIDRVIKGDKGGYLIIDYKTSKREKTKTELFQDSQLKGYVYAICNMYGVKPQDVVAAHYYPLTGNFVHLTYSPAQISAHVNKVVDEVWKIRKKKKEDFVSMRNDFCNWCAYKGACPEFNDQATCTKKIDELKERKKMLNEQKKNKK